MTVGKWYTFKPRAGTSRRGFMARYEGFEDGNYQFLEGFVRRSIGDLGRYEISPV